MTEKRFYITDTGLGLDTESDEMYSFGDEEDFCRLFDKLNEQQGIIEEKSNVIVLMGAFIKSKGFSIDDFDEWISNDWHNVGDDV